MPDTLSAELRRQLRRNFDNWVDAVCQWLEACGDRLPADCDRRDLAAGDILLAPGRHNDHVFIVLSGCLTVHVGSPEQPALATMETGACVGEMSIIEDRDCRFFDTQPFGRCRV